MGCRGSFDAEGVNHEVTKPRKCSRHFVFLRAFESLWLSSSFIRCRPLLGEVCTFEVKWRDHEKAFFRRRVARHLVYVQESQGLGRVLGDVEGDAEQERLQDLRAGDGGAEGR